MSKLSEAEGVLRELFAPAEGGYSDAEKRFMKGRIIDRQNPVIMEQLDTIRRWLDKADRDAHIFEATLDHLQHIKTEIGRLEYQLAQDGIIPAENNNNGRFEG
jgi:hypothetical protein